MPFFVQWDIPADSQRMGEEHPLLVARCTKIIPGSISLEAAARAAQQATAQAQAAEQAANGETPSSSSAPASTSAPGASAAGGEGGLGSLARALGGGDRKPNADEEDKYVINVKQIAKFVVGLGDKVASTDIEEGMRVG